MKMTRDKTRSRTIWLWDKANWNGFRHDLENINWGVLLRGNINEQVKIFTDLILSLQELHVPHKTYTIKPNDQPWFGARCRKAADDKSKAWTRYKRSPSRRNKNLYDRACQEMKRVQKWAKKHWKSDMRRKLSGISVGSREWWNLVKSQQGFAPDDSIPPLDKSDGTVATSSEEKAELFASYFANKMTVQDARGPTPAVPSKTNKTLSSLVITQGGVEHQLLNVDVKKSLGPDGISPYTLKRCAYQLAYPLAHLFRLCLTEQEWPYLWKWARVVAAHKKSSKSSVQNYRPISLLSVVGKIFEKIISDEVTLFLDQNFLLSDKQFGFRRERSTSDLLLHLSTPWQQSLDKGNYTYVVALDIAGAFDRVWHNGIIEKLKSFGIAGDLLKLFENYLRGRTLRVVVNGSESKEYPIEASVPQGSVIGPLLWNVYFNDILQLIPEAYAFADDCTLTFTCNDNNRQETITKINEALQLIMSWGNRWQVSLAPQKTQMMVISRRQEAQNIHLPNIKLNGKILAQQPSINILGVEIDSTLSFTNHVRDLAARCAKKLGCIRRISHLLDARGCLMLYNSQVRSIMEYSPLVWSSCPPSYLRLLDRVQDRARRLIESKSGDNNIPIVFQPLQHRRNVAGLCVFYKIYVLRVSHLMTLSLPTARSFYNTRSASAVGYEIEIPFARTEQYLRSFLPKYSRMWNRIIQNVDLHHINSMQQFKAAVHIFGLLNF